MNGEHGPRDHRLNAARYRLDGSTGPDSTAPGESEEHDGDSAGQSTMEGRAHFVELSIQQAVRRGDFDNLPGAGKPLANLHPTHDPDWWIRQKIHREQITGLGPAALTLRTENGLLDGRLDALASERDVRETLESFNARVIEARRQLQGGPPVVTPTRDIDTEVAHWLERQRARLLEGQQTRDDEAAAWNALTRRERRRAKRGGPAG